MRKPWTRALLATGLLLPAGLMADAPAATACINGVSYETKPAIQQATLAEKALGAGKPAEAFAELELTFHELRLDPRLKDINPGMGLDPVAVRAQRLAAVAVVRAEGLLTMKPSFFSVTASERRANLEWAIGILRAFRRLKPGPAIETDLAEALSKLPESREEARATLEGLDKKDVVTSPEGYRVLAELRLAAGDSAGSQAARKRFEAMRGQAAKAKG